MDAGTIIQTIDAADVVITALAGSAAISEVLPFVKKVKANSTFQLAFNILRTLIGVFSKK